MFLVNNDWLVLSQFSWEIFGITTSTIMCWIKDRNIDFAKT